MNCDRQRSTCYVYHVMRVAPSPRSQIAAGSRMPWRQATHRTFAKLLGGQHKLRRTGLTCSAVQQDGRGAVPLRRLGRTNLHVPVLCFGCMLMGESCGWDTASKLLSACWDAGITFYDTAEMYPVPQCAATYGDSERMLGRWMRGMKREEAIISTKVAGPSGQMEWIRGGPLKLDAANITQAIDGSLARLGTDYIDILHLHWPDRYVPMFGEVDYDPTLAFTTVPIEEQLEAMGRAQAAGKVRHVALSNETPYGLTHAVMLSVQNALSLTCRTFDAGLAEVCHLEGVSLLAYSPLAMGLLTGKYLSPDGGPPDARLNKYKGRYAEAESRYGFRPAVLAAVAEYCRVAREAGMTPTELSLRWVLGRPLVTSAIIGATSLPQLQELVAAARCPPLPPDVLAAIDEVHARYPSPTP